MRACLSGRSGPTARTVRNQHDRAAPAPRPSQPPAAARRPSTDDGVRPWARGARAPGAHAYVIATPASTCRTCRTPRARAALHGHLPHSTGTCRRANTDRTAPGAPQTAGAPQTHRTDAPEAHPCAPRPNRATHHGQTEQRSTARDGTTRQAKARHGRPTPSTTAPSTFRDRAAPMGKQHDGATANGRKDSGAMAHAHHASPSYAGAPRPTTSTCGGTRCRHPTSQTPLGHRETVGPRDDATAPGEGRAQRLR